MVECLESQRGNCSGPVLYRDPLSATGRRFPRCEKHWHARLAEHERQRKAREEQELQRREREARDLY